MTGAIAHHILDESLWLPLAMALAAMTALGVWFGAGVPPEDGRRRVLGVMALFHGTMIAAMAFGHLLAVGVKSAQGELESSGAKLVLIGVALAVPSAVVMRSAWRMTTPRGSSERAVLLGSGWLAVTLLALGLHNLPLALPAAFSAAYRWQPHRVVGRAVIWLWVVVMAALFVAGMVFFLSDARTFEEFQGM